MIAWRHRTVCDGSLRQWGAGPFLEIHLSILRNICPGRSDDTIGFYRRDLDIFRQRIRAAEG